MSIRDKYQPDYKTLYPGVEITPEIEKHLKRSDRKMKYMEIEIKHGVYRQDTGEFMPTREESLERLLDEEHIDFVSPDPTPDEIALHKDEIDRLCMALKQLKPREYALVHEVFFEGKTEETLAIQAGITQQAVSKKLNRIYRKIKKFMKS